MQNDMHIENVQNEMPQAQINDKSFWGKVDLKVLLATLSLAEPPISQAKVASLLKISPVTMSRLVNSDNVEDHKIRDAWIPTLAECLSTVDIDTVQETVSSLRYIKSRQRKRELLSAVQHAVEKYLLKNNSNYQLDPTYWGKSIDTICFSNETNRWLIELGPSLRSLNSDRLNAMVHDMLSSYSRMRSIQKGDKISTAFTDADAFAKFVRLIQQNISEDKEAGQSTTYQSLLLCDPKSEIVLEEFLISDPEGLHHI